MRQSWALSHGKICLKNVKQREAVFCVYDRRQSNSKINIDPAIVTLALLWGFSVSHALRQAREMP